MIKIDLYTAYHNDELIVPFVINYWKLLPLRKIFIMNEDYSDNGLNLIRKQFGDKVQIISSPVNESWKQSKGSVDFVIVCNFDECLYNESILQDLQKMKKEGYNLMKTNIVSIISQNFPAYSDKLLHEYDDVYVRFIGEHNKNILFDPDKINEEIKIYKNKCKLIYMRDLSWQFVLSKNNYDQSSMKDFFKEYFADQNVNKRLSYKEANELIFE